MSRSTGAAVAQAASTVLITLAAGQFLMTLDSSVMNVAIATVAEDVGTTITGIQTAITLYTLVMAMLMISGGKIGSMIGRRRAFAIGCVIYGIGSLTTALAPNLPVLILGWSEKIFPIISEFDDYVGSIRADSRMSLGTAITYKLNREIAIKGEYRYDQLRSNIEGVDYSANVFLVALKLQR